MSHCHEWTNFDKIRNSMEMFARNVIPYFPGYDGTYQDEWRLIQKKTAGGKIARVDNGKPHNLVTN